MGRFHGNDASKSRAARAAAGERAGGRKAKRSTDVRTDTLLGYGQSSQRQDHLVLSQRRKANGLHGTGGVCQGGTVLYLLRRSIQCGSAGAQWVSWARAYCLYLSLSASAINASLASICSFLDTQNQKDYVQIRLGLSPTDPLGEQRARLLSTLNIERKAELRVLPAPEHISGELLAFVRVFNMSAEQLEHWCSDLGRAVDLLHIDCALETDLETRTWQYMYQRLKLLLGVLEATLHETDEVQQLEALQLNENQEDQKQQAHDEIDIMLLQYRRLERRILTDALQYAQERLKV